MFFNIFIFLSVTCLFFVSFIVLISLFSFPAAAKELQKCQLCTRVVYCRTCSSSSAAGFLETFLLSLNIAASPAVHAGWSSKALFVEGRLVIRSGAFMCVIF